MARIDRTAGRGFPRRMVFLDTEAYQFYYPETRTELQPFRLGVGIFVEFDGCNTTNRHVLRFECVDTFWAWLAGRLQRGTVTTVYAHNAHYDLTQLGFWRRLVSREYRTHLPGPIRAGGPSSSGKPSKPWKGLLVLERAPYIVQCVHDRGRVDFVDTFNYFDVSLAALAVRVGMEKLPMPHWTECDEAWMRYCANDAEVIERAMVGLIREWVQADLGAFKPTASMLALSSFRRQHRGRPIQPPEVVAARDIARRGYFGGRVSCFYFGSAFDPEFHSHDPEPVHYPPQRSAPLGPVYYLDVASLYPAVMAAHRYPVAFGAGWQRPPPDRLRRCVERTDCVATVRLSARRAEYPYRGEDGVLYPVGQFLTTLCGPELRRAVADGEVDECIECWELVCEDLFSRWVDQWWRRRLDCRRKGDAAGEGLAKLVLNSLSGRFAIRTSRWQDAELVAAPIPWGRWLHRTGEDGQYAEYRSIGWRAQQKCEREETPKTMTIISALITAHARNHMRGLRESCPARSVLYTDTDSLLVTQAGFDALTEAGQVQVDTLGKLRLVHRASHVVLFGARNYRMDGVDVVSGISLRARPVGPRRWVQAAFPTATNLERSDPTRGVVVRHSPVHRPGGPRGQWVGPDGWAEPVPLPLADAPTGETDCPPPRPPER